LAGFGVALHDLEVGGEGLADLAAVGPDVPVAPAHGLGALLEAFAVGYELREDLEAGPFLGAVLLGAGAVVPHVGGGAVGLVVLALHAGEVLLEFLDGALVLVDAVAQFPGFLFPALLVGNESGNLLGDGGEALLVGFELGLVGGDGGLEAGEAAAQ